MREQRKTCDKTKKDDHTPRRSVVKTQVQRLCSPAVKILQEKRAAHRNLHRYAEDLARKKWFMRVLRGCERQDPAPRAQG
jgi:hypothetical protein